ncbi:hypothetical protein Tco_1412639, partial [Tanacetum coccineum]
ALSEQVEVLGNDTGYTIQSVQHQLGPGHPNTFHYTYFDKNDEDEPSKVLKVQKSIHPLSGTPTPSSDSIIASPSPSLTPLENNNFLLKETDAFLALDSIPPGINNEIFDAEGDILLLEKLLNIDSTKDLPPQELNNDSEEPSDTFLMGDTEIKFNPLKDIDDPVPIPRNEESDESDTETVMEEVQIHIS